MKFFSKSTLMAGVMGLSSLAAYAEIGIAFDGNYNMDTVAQVSNDDTSSVSATGLDYQLEAQFILGGKSSVMPYIGLGLGYVQNIQTSNAKSISDPSLVTYKRAFKSVPYVTVEVGPEFAFSRARWQVYGAYDYGFGGSESFSGTFNGTTSSQLATLSTFTRAKIGTRLYYVASAHFDIGLNLNYVFSGSAKMKADSTSGFGQIKDPTATPFTGITAGLALRGRFY
jgi:hypothetical protein